MQEVSGTVCGLVYLGDVIDHLFLTLWSLQVFFVSVRVGGDESIFAVFHIRFGGRYLGDHS